MTCGCQCHNELRCSAGVDIVVEIREQLMVVDSPCGVALCLRTFIEQLVLPYYTVEVLLRQHLHKVTPRDLNAREERCLVACIVPHFSRSRRVLVCSIARGEDTRVLCVDGKCLDGIDGSVCCRYKVAEEVVGVEVLA